MTLPANYHRDWQRRRAAESPEWYAARKRRRTEARREHKQHWVERLGGKCADCGGTFPPEVYDFHHPDEKTKARLPKRSTNFVLMRSRKRAEEELRLCVLVCANCHRIRHAKACLR